MDRDDSKIQEIYSASISVKGRALIYGNIIYPVSSIVSLTFDEKVMEKEYPKFFYFLEKTTWSLLKKAVLLLLSCIILIFAEQLLSPASTIITIPFYAKDLIRSIGLFFGVLSISSALIVIFCGFFKIIFWFNKNYTVYGLNIELINNDKIIFISDGNNNFFVKRTLNALYEVISGYDYFLNKEIIIDFSSNTINIEKVDNSNVIGGNVVGNLT